MSLNPDLPNPEQRNQELFKRDENGEVSVHNNWRVGLAGKALLTQTPNNVPYGFENGLLNTQNELTELGRQYIQWGAWFITGNAISPALAESTPQLASPESISIWQASMENTIVKATQNQTLIRTSRNLALLQSLRQTTLTAEDWAIANSTDLLKSPILNAFEIVETQPGYWGHRRTSHKIDHYNLKYGNVNWNVGFRYYDNNNALLLTPHQFAEQYFQKAYIDYFSQNPEQLCFLAKNAKELYEELKFQDDDLGMGYDITSYKTNTKYQFAIMRRLIEMIGLKFEGDKMLMIRGAKKGDPESGPQFENYGGIGRILHPGAVALPISMQRQLPQGESRLHGSEAWWEAWEKDALTMNHTRFPEDRYGHPLVSVEQGYHRAKAILLKRNPNQSIAQQLVH